MNKKTIGFKALIVAILFCGLPGLTLVVLTMLGISDPIGSSPLFDIVAGIFQIAIPIGVYFLVFRREQSQTKPDQTNSSDRIQD